MKEQLIVGLDIGTSHTRIAVGRIGILPDQRLALSVMGAVETPTQGVARGAITSLDDAVTSLATCLERTERQVGLPISDVTVGVGGTTVTLQEGRGVVGVSRPDGDIRREDVARAVESAKALMNPANQYLIHTLERSFTLDGQQGIKDPIGMQGIRLEADILIVQALTSHVRNITNAVFRSGLDVTRLVYAPLAAAEVVTSPRERELGVCVAILGASTTGLVVYENGELLHATTLPIGADHITSDIAIGLRISLDAAEQIKRVYGTAVPEQVSKKEDLNLMDFGATSSEVVSLRDIAGIIEARVEEIFEKIEAELRKVDRQGMLPAGVVLTGGGAKLVGMIDVAKRVLRLPSSIGTISVPSTMPEVIQDPSFSTAIGLILWSYEMERREDAEGSSGKGLLAGVGIKNSSAFLSTLLNPIKKIGKSFIP